MNIDQTPTNPIAKILIIIAKIFFIGLLLQFFLQTFVTFKLGRSGVFWDIFWSWKEIVIIVFGGIMIYRLRITKFWKTLLYRIGLKGFTISLAILIIFVLISNIFFLHTGLSAIIYSLRYSITGFIIFLVFALLFWNFLEETTNIEKWYSKIIGRLLRGSLFRRAIIFFIPRLLEFTGYNMYNYEGSIDTAPPAAYYSQYNEGYVRNQFLFERPISRGFFLVAFWPLFFAFAIKQRGRKKTLTWGSLYALAILSTFSRAAWIARIIQTGILILIEYRKNLKQILLYGGLPILLLFGTVTYLGRDQIISRQFSNTGHLKSIQIAFQKIKDSPWFGEGAGSAGPASYHLGSGKEYNPENQFLQIWIEYGIFGFLFWIGIYIRLHRVGLEALQHTKQTKTSKQQRYFGFLVFCFSLGLAGLSICGFVLHSFVDRMIVYPFMALFGITYAHYKKLIANNS